jgi:hypothetical protein
MKVETVNKWLSVCANFGLIAGLLLVAMQLRQNADLMRVQLLSDGITTDQDIESAMFGDDGSIAWAKSIEDPSDLTSAEIKVMDGYLITQVYSWQRLRLLEEEGLLPAGSTESAIKTGQEFYFGNRFAKVWWKHESQNHSDSEFVRMIDESLDELDDQRNLRWLNQMHKDLSDDTPPPT